MKDLFSEISGGWTVGRELKLLYNCQERNLPVEAYSIEECADEKSGMRYGQALKRRGWAVKLGGGGRNKGNRYAYQIWGVVKPEYRTVL